MAKQKELTRAFSTFMRRHVKLSTAKSRIDLRIPRKDLYPFGVIMKGQVVPLKILLLDVLEHDLDRKLWL